MKSFQELSTAGEEGQYLFWRICVQGNLHHQQMFRCSQNCFKNLIDQNQFRRKSYFRQKVYTNQRKYWSNCAKKHFASLKWKKISVDLWRSKCFLDLLLRNWYIKKICLNKSCVKVNMFFEPFVKNGLIKKYVSKICWSLSNKSCAKLPPSTSCGPG